MRVQFGYRTLLFLGFLLALGTSKAFGYGLSSFNPVPDNDVDSGEVSGTDYGTFDV